MIKVEKKDLLSQQLSNMQYNIINYSHQAIYYIISFTFLFCNSKLIYNVLSAKYVIQPFECRYTYNFTPTSLLKRTH